MRVRWEAIHIDVNLTSTLRERHVEASRPNAVRTRAPREYVPDIPGYAESVGLSIFFIFYGVCA